MIDKLKLAHVDDVDKIRDKDKHALRIEKFVLHMIKDFS